MSETSPATIETLFDRTQRPTYAPTRRSRLRTVATFTLLVILVAMIGGYLFITDPQRVRAISQSYLSKLTGGPVSVQRASLSIFEGLRLDGIRIEVDDRGVADSLLFEARSLHIGYNPAALLLGRIEATRILALDPRVHVVEDVDAGIWNFQRLNTSGRNQVARDFAGTGSKMPLPEVLLRNARFDYAQIAGGKRTDVGTLTIEGQLTPDPADETYRFRLQSRGGTSGVFPIAEGWLEPGGKQLGLVLRDVEFVNEIKTILPAVVRRFWEDHQLAGRIGETRVSYFRKESGKAGFRVETDLDGVRLVMPPEKWMGPGERWRVDRWSRNFTRLASPAMGASPVARMLIGAMQPGSLQLDEVDGTFIFTDESIDISNLVARIENNRFKLSGQLLGYGPTAPFKVRVESLRSENIRIPEAPRYIKSMPWPVQEIYYRFRPVGEASFWLEASRLSPGDKPTLAGQVNIHDAAFTFERFPYPVDRASGVLKIGTDPQTGLERLQIVSLKGRGYRGGANENATVEVMGTVSPLDENAGADIVVRGQDLVSERLLIESMPPETKKTVKRFDADNTGVLPTFKGSFECRIHCPQGASRHWDIVTTLDIQNASGKLAAFPYPLKDLAMDMVVHDTFIQINQARMERGGGEVNLSGRVDWAKRIPGTNEPLVQTNFALKAKRVPIDDALLDALPESKRKWLREVKLAGVVDIEGRIIPETPESDEPVADIAVTLHDGSMRLGDAVDIVGISAAGRIAASKASITNATAKRGDATIEAKATFDWSDENDPTIVATATVRSLAIDKSLVESLPARSRESVEALSPSGTVDLDIDYAAGGYRVVARPKALSITPKSLGIELKDLAGEVAFDKQAVTLKDVTARVGDAKLQASGTFEPSSGAVAVSLAGRELKVTDELLAALPESVRRVVKSAELSGTVAFELSKLSVVPKEKSSEVEFDGSVWLSKASLQAGVPMTDVNGVVSARGRASGGEIRELAGEVQFESLKLAGRDVEKMTATIVKPAGQDLLQIGKIDGKIAGGQIGGQIDTILSAKDSRFGLSLVLRNANVPELTGELEKPIDGRLTASLSLEGRWDDSTTRRGRGDVLVEGKQMYRVPVLFGLMQIANLTLPLEAPLQQAGVRYTVEGNRITLDTIDLRGKTTAMQGSGWIDFGTKQVQMSLMMGNSAADAVPIFGDLIRGARQDLLQIRIKGSLEEPKVGASAFNTITTTVDEVLKGDN